MLSLLVFMLSLTADIFPDQSAIIKHEEYAQTLQRTLTQTYHSRFEASLYGQELEHIIIWSSMCRGLKEYQLVGAREVGIMSCVCKDLGHNYWLKLQ